MDIQLTTGAVKEMLSQNPMDDPILQIMQIKSMCEDRYRVYINDGEYSSGGCLLGFQLNDLVKSKQIDANCIVKVTQHNCNVLKSDKRVLVILDLTVLKAGSAVGSTIGNPTVITGNENLSSSMTSRTSTSNSVPNRPPLALINESTASFNSKNESMMNSGKPSMNIHSIDTITPYQNKWTIQVRVTNKSDIRTWSNARGEGKLFTVDVLDKSGEIRATAFNDECDKFYDMFQVGKVYTISQAQLKIANKRFNNLKNDYEMSFNQGTQVNFCEDDSAIPEMQYDFKSIDQIESLEKDAIVDVIGVIKVTEDLSTIVSKNTQKEFKKRDIQIMDESGKEIQLTLWGATAENFDGTENPILAAKGVKVGDFNGKSLSATFSSSFQINPNIKEFHRLRAWYENTGSKMETVNLSNHGNRTFGVSGSLKTIGEAVVENLGCSGNADYYSTKASFTFIRKDNCLYPGCPAKGCNKKVIDMNNGLYRCEKCAKEYDTFNWRLMVFACLADGTDSTWVTLFQDQAETLLGRSSADLGSLKEQDSDAFEEIITNACFQSFMLKIRTKLETYNGESRKKSTVVEIQKCNHVEYCKHLIADIKKMSGIQIV